MLIHPLMDPVKLPKHRKHRAKRRNVSIGINRWSAHPYYFINAPDGLDYRIIRALTKEMSYFVQGAERSKKFKEGRWDGTTCLLYKTRKGVYYFPVGMLDCVKRVFSDFEVDYFIQDITVDDVKKRYKPIDLTWTGHTLRDYQKKAVMEIKKNSGGTIFLPTGSGKTLVMLRLIYEYNLPCLILVHTRELLYQWEKNIKACFNGRVPGLIGDGHMQWDPITVAMIQTLSQKIVKDKMDNIDYPILCADECFPYNTLVETENGAMKIGDIVRNRLDIKVLTHTGEYKRVIGWHEKPLNKSMVRVVHDCGSFECTEDHKILTDDGWVMAKYLNTGDIMYIYNDIQMQDMPEGVSNPRCGGRSCEHSSCAPGSSTESGDKILEHCNRGGKTRAIKKTYGYIVKQILENSYNRVPNTNDTWESHGGHVNLLSTSEKQISEVEGSSRFKTARVRSVEILDIKGYNVNSSQNDCEQRIRELHNIISNEKSPMLDTNIQFNNVEQWKEEDYRGMVGVHNTPDSTCSVVDGRWMFSEEFDYLFNGSIYYRRSRTRGSVVGGQVGNFRWESGSSQGNSITITQKRTSKKICGTSRTLHNTIDGIQDKLFDLTVEDNHTYTANGVVVSNCHHTPCDTLYMVAMKTNAIVRIGASATPTRTDGAQKKIWAATGEIKTTVSAEELINSGVLAKPSFIFLTPPAMYVGRRAHYSEAYTHAIVINESRNDLIVKKATEFAKNGETVYVHVSRIDHGEILAERIPGAVFLCGRDNTTKRQSVLKKYGKGDIKVLVSTLLGEGADIPGIDCFIAASGGKSEISTIQRAGRALRIATGKTTATIVDFRDSGRWFGDHWQDRYNSYKKTYGDCVPDV
jgi:DNA excision repair protein ERCC-3